MLLPLLPISKSHLIFMVVIISHKQCKVAAMSQVAAMHRLYSIN